MAQVQTPDGTTIKTTSKKDWAVVGRREQDGPWVILSTHARRNLAERNINEGWFARDHDVTVVPVTR